MPLDLPGTPFHKAMKVRSYLALLCLEFYFVFVLHTLYFLRVKSIKETYIFIDFVYLQFLIITGAGFWSCLIGKARKQLNETLKKLIQKRRQSRRQGGGLLGVLLGDKDDEKLNNQLSDSQIADNIIGVIFAAHDTTASVLTWILKYLHDNEDLLEAVTVS